ncbi:ABC transporter permease subunit [Cucumibacter marinus]|uniref:ABC transporter permease subunit n=1 Tax=Cucumibacter marinus TaxID=1121252 RepID=UPI000415FD96|nr:ABC transporter permease subunit [Cucumibacter marinus]
MTRAFLRISAGLALAAAIAILIAAVLGSLYAAAERFAITASADAGIWRLLAGNLVQAGLSVVFSLAVGMAIAWALNRLAFPGRRLFLAFLSTGLVLPALVIAFGVIAIWGRNGWVNHALDPMGLGLPGTIFGLHGILVAHVVLNGSFAARIFSNRLDALPSPQLRLGQSLGLSPWRRFVTLDLPAMLPALPGLTAIIFLVCFTSFAIVLVLGGGPANATFEVAIYEAAKIEFDLALAARLALIQLVVCLIVIVPVNAFPVGSAMIGVGDAPRRWRDPAALRWLQRSVLVLAGLGFGLPLLAIMWRGIGPETLPALVSPAFITALVTSLAIATLSTVLCLALALCLGLARANVALVETITGKTRSLMKLFINLPGFAYLAMPAVVLSLGFFLIARLAGFPPQTLAVPVLILANALLALPLSASAIAPALEKLTRRTARLQVSLGLSGWRRFRAVEWPYIRPDLGYAAAIAFCFSLGDLGVIALFGTSDFATLPWLMYRAMGSYRTDLAAVIAMALLVLTLFVFLVLPRLIAGRSHARA